MYVCVYTNACIQVKLPEVARAAASQASAALLAARPDLSRRTEPSLGEAEPCNKNISTVTRNVLCIYV